MQNGKDKLRFSIFGASYKSLRWWATWLLIIHGFVRGGVTSDPIKPSHDQAQEPGWQEQRETKEGDELHCFTTTRSVRGGKGEDEVKHSARQLG